MSSDPLRYCAFATEYEKNLQKHLSDVHIFRDYLIFYDPERNPPLILRVIHGKRDVAAALKRLEQDHE